MNFSRFPSDMQDMVFDKMDMKTKSNFLKTTKSAKVSVASSLNFKTQNWYSLQAGINKILGCLSLLRIFSSKKLTTPRECSWQSCSY